MNTLVRHAHVSARRVITELKKPENRPVKYFLLAGSVFGLLFVFLIPPLQGADEGNHLMRAYQVSEGNWVSDYVTGYKVNAGFETPFTDKNVGGALPSGLVDLATETSSKLPGHTEVKYDKKQLYYLRTFKNDGRRTNAAFVNTAVYSPAAYLPSLPGIYLSRLVGARPFMMVYLARLSTLFIGLAIVALAIYLMPFGRLGFAVLALVPMVLLQLSVVTADTMVVSLSFLSVALVTRFAFRNRNLTRNEILLLIFVFGLLALTKPGLFLMSLTSLALLRNAAIPRKKALLIAGGTILTSLALALAWNGVVKDLAIFGFEKDYAGYKAIFNSTVNYSGQMHFILAHPLTYLRVMYESFLTLGFNGVPVSFIGNFGWQDAQLPHVFVIAAFVNIVLAVFIASQFEKVHHERWLRSLNVITGILIGVAVMTTLYLLTIPVKYPSVLAYMQGRYFIPSALLFILAASGGRQYISKARYNALGQRCLIASVILLGIMLFVVTVRFYNLGETTESLWHHII